MKCTLAWVNNHGVVVTDQSYRERNNTEVDMHPKMAACTHCGIYPSGTEGVTHGVCITFTTQLCAKWY